MEPIEGSETSAIINQTPGNYPKENLLYSVHGESLESRIVGRINCICRQTTYKYLYSTCIWHTKLCSRVHCWSVTHLYIMLTVIICICLYYWLMDEQIIGLL